MKTKSLLIAAATLAAGIISSQAAVYSQNVVGYYNVPIAGNKYAMVANQLNLNNTNGISDIFTGGLVSDVNGVNNTVIWLWNSGTAQYASYQYFSSADALTDFGVATAGWWDAGVPVLHNEPLVPGRACFIQNYNNTNPITVTVTGNVAQGTNILTLNQGYSLVGSPVPVSTNICSDAVGFVGYSDVNGVNNDVIWLWNPAVGQYSSFQYFNAADALTDFGVATAGFWDAGIPALQNVAPSVGSGFYIQRLVAGSTVWTNTFIVQ
jgi:hypothetical protein